MPKRPRLQLASMTRGSPQPSSERPTAVHGIHISETTHTHRHTLTHVVALHARFEVLFHCSAHRNYTRSEIVIVRNIFRSGRKLSLGLLPMDAKNTVLGRRLMQGSRRPFTGDGSAQVQVTNQRPVPLVFGAWAPEKVREISFEARSS